MRIQELVDWINGCAKRTKKKQNIIAEYHKKNVDGIDPKLGGLTDYKATINVDDDIVCGYTIRVSELEKSKFFSPKDAEVDTEISLADGLMRMMVECVGIVKFKDLIK